eukprot:418687-Prymnesium_polylepis.2
MASPGCHVCLAINVRDDLPHDASRLVVEAEWYGAVEQPVVVEEDGISPPPAMNVHRILRESRLTDRPKVRVDIALLFRPKGGAEQPCKLVHTFGRAHPFKALQSLCTSEQPLGTVCTSRLDQRP